MWIASKCFSSVLQAVFFNITAVFSYFFSSPSTMDDLIMATCGVMAAIWTNITSSKYNFKNNAMIAFCTARFVMLRSPSPSVNTYSRGLTQFPSLIVFASSVVHLIAVLPWPIIFLILWAFIFFLMRIKHVHICMLYKTRLFRCNNEDVYVL